MPFFRVEIPEGHCSRPERLEHDPNTRAPFETEWAQGASPNPLAVRVIRDKGDGKRYLEIAVLDRFFEQEGN